MRKLLYSNEKKSEVLKIGIYITIAIIIFLTIWQGYFIIKEGGKFDFSVYLIALIWFGFVIIGTIIDDKFNNPIRSISIKQHKELIQYGKLCEGEILEIKEHNGNYKSIDTYHSYTYYTLKVRYFSKIYNEYKEVETNSIQNITKNDIIGHSKKCIVYEKEDTIMRDTSDLYTGENNKVDLVKFGSFKNIKNGLKVKTTRGYAFIVSEADIIKKN